MAMTLADIISKSIDKLTTNIQYIVQCNGPVAITGSTSVVPTITNRGIDYFNFLRLWSPLHVRGIFSCSTECYD